MEKIQIVKFLTRINYKERKHKKDLKIKYSNLKNKKILNLVFFFIILIIQISIMYYYLIYG